ncbi:M23 family metallopeptidase [Acidobacteriota bacterium]
MNTTKVFKVLCLMLVFTLHHSLLVSLTAEDNPSMMDDWEPGSDVHADLIETAIEELLAAEDDWENLWNSLPLAIQITIDEVLAETVDDGGPSTSGRINEAEHSGTVMLGQALDDVNATFVPTGPSSEPERLLNSNSFLFDYPLQGGRGYLFNQRVYNKKKRKYEHHTGLDLIAAGGTPIRAANFGRRSLRVNNCQSDHGLGNVVGIEYLLDDGTNLWSLDCHMSAHRNLNGRPNGTVAIPKSTMVGQVGGTGYCQAHYWGDHDHFELKRGNQLDNPRGPGQHWGYTPYDAKQFGYEKPDDFVGRRRVLMPEFSLTDSGWGDYDILYGTAGKRLYARLMLVGSKEVFDELLVRGRSGFSTTVVDFPAVSQIRGPYTYVASRKLAAGDYTFWAALKKGSEWREGYPIILTVLPSSEDFIRDNDMGSQEFQSWGLSTARYDGYGYGAYAALGNVNAGARWLIRRQGRFAPSVYIGANGVGKVRYKVYPTAGSAPILTDPVDLTSNRFRWVELKKGSTSSWNFDVTGYVELAAGSGSHNEIYLFDAVKFTKLSDETVPSKQLEIDPGSLSAGEMRNLQTRWGVNRCAIYRQGNPNAYLTFTVTVPTDYTASNVEIVMRSCNGISAAPYGWSLNNRRIMTFMTGVDEDRVWTSGGVQLSFEFQEYRPGNVDNCGIMKLRVPTAMFNPGVPNRFHVYAVKDGGPWDWFMLVDSPPGVASAEEPIEDILDVRGSECGEWPSSYGPFQTCVARAKLGSSSSYEVKVRMPEDAEHIRPSVIMRAAQGIHRGQHKIYLNGTYLGRFDSGNDDSRSWDLRNATLWWRLDRHCHCGTDYNGWLILTAHGDLWRPGVNTIRIKGSGISSGPWDWSAVTDCAFADELLEHSEGYKQFLTGCTNCEVLPTAWGPVWGCYERMSQSTERIVFQSEPAVSSGGNSVVLSWLGANGINEAKHKLRANGKDILTFDSGQASDRTWVSKDGRSRLTFKYVEYLPGQTDYNGIYTLVLPTTVAPPFEKVNLEIQPETDGGPNDWVAVFGFTETEKERNTYLP